MPFISAILLAAGESTRMGRLKALLPWQEVTLVEYQVKTLDSAGVSEIIVVLGHSYDEIALYLWPDNARVVNNPLYKQGKSTSIKAGFSAVSSKADAVLLLAVDQPRPLPIVKSLIETHLESDALITAPRYQGHGGHPVIFSTSLKGELEAITEERLGIRDVMDSHQGKIHWVDMDDPIVRLDINDPESYERAKALFSE